MHIYFQHVDSINWCDVAIIFKATYARFEKEKNYFMVSTRTLQEFYLPDELPSNMLWTVFMNTLKPDWENAAETWTIWGLCLLIRGMGEQ